MITRVKPYWPLEDSMKNWTLFFCLVAIVCTSAEASNPFRMAAQNSHQIVLLNNGLASLEERLQMIERAEHSIDVEYFIYNLDKSGRIFTQALIKKARAGVKVRMLLDYFMVKNEFSPFYAFEIEKYGIEVKYYNPTATLNFISGQYRNHRKTLIIDGKEALTGGRNIADEYFDLREDYNFLDRDLEVKGDIVGPIQETFNHVWGSALSKKVARQKKPDRADSIYGQDQGILDDLRYEDDLKKWNQKIEKAQNFLTVEYAGLFEVIRAKGKLELAREYRGTCESMSFNSEYPNNGSKNSEERIIKHDIAERISSAEESILFDSPYFIVSNEASDALKQALANKVDVTLLTNSLNSTDAVYVYGAFDNGIKNWISKGLHPYIYRGSIQENYATMNDQIAHARYGVHAKSFVFDNKDVVIGTYNFDPRSANLNTEMTVACDNNPELARIVSEDIKGRMKNSILLDSSEKVDKYKFYSVSFFKGLEYLALKIPSLIFESLL